MSSADRSRYLPPRMGRSRSATPPPRWFTREAAAAFDLSPFAQVAMAIIADNLDAEGASRTSTSLISSRGNMSRNAAAAAIDSLLDVHVLFELDEKQSGRIMRYAIPAEMPWPGDGRKSR